MCTCVCVCVRARADVTSCGHQGSANIDPLRGIDSVDFRVQTAAGLGVQDAKWSTMHFFRKTFYAEFTDSSSKFLSSIVSSQSQNVRFFHEM